MKWLTVFLKAKDVSVNERKPILLQFEMGGCGGCKTLYEKTYTDPQVQQELIDWFVPLKLDLIRDREVRRELAAYWTPSFYFLDHTGKPHFNFNGYLPPEEFRVVMRLGLAETLIPRGKYDEVLVALRKDREQLTASSLFPKLLVQENITAYIKTKDSGAFRQAMNDLRYTFPNSLEAKLHFWDK
ncbi:MAG TPA: thioredoxin fold domain-containing protein [bacterium]|nr:thioredoxin fold domain-containing protein [bacterium]HNT67013.1 thioredoxin fold domain-containing protein [bacterium]HOX86890.1 thioredoxin fold domain-containing protein [bacterium]HPG46221.1 thioredoxin fold domain-containing protein [bacterium]HPM98585.1 thioredoxin fold domain-containing protein [bacterium]